jgi:hypothetical protein
MTSSRTASELGLSSSSAGLAAWASVVAVRSVSYGTASVRALARTSRSPRGSAYSCRSPLVRCQPSPSAMHRTGEPAGSAAGTGSAGQPARPPPGRLDPDWLTRSGLKYLERENAALKRPLAGAEPEKAALEIVEGNL